MRRGIEWDLLPWCRQRQLPIMAYSPVEQGQLLRQTALQKIAQDLNATPAQVAIAWLLHQNVIVIPKSSSIHHVEQNQMALELKMTPEVLNALDAAFPPPNRRMSLAML